jgi:hypothetical protein
MKPNCLMSLSSINVMLSRQNMEQTQQDKEILQADKATPAADETESEKIVEVLNLLYANLLKAMRLMWYQLFFTGTLIILFFIAFFLLLSKAPPMGSVVTPGQKIMEEPLPTSDITISPQATRTQQPKVEETVPQPPLVGPESAAPEQPKAGQPEAEHSKADLTKPKKASLKKKPKKAKPKKVQSLFKKPSVATSAG